MDKQMAMQEAFQPLRGRMFQQDKSRPKEHRILALKTGVAGIQFHIKSEEEREALKNLEPGTELLLYREPDNKYDQWAIAVHLTEDDKIGFMTRFKNETIARLMDAGKKFVAIVDDPSTDEEAKGIAEKELRRNSEAPTENMAVPFSVYLVEEV